jgi:hypothetical protein
MSGRASSQTRVSTDVTASPSDLACAEAISTLTSAPAPDRSKSTLRQLFLRPSTWTSAPDMAAASDRGAVVAPQPNGESLPSLFLSTLTPAADDFAHRTSPPSFSALPSLFLHQAPSSLDLSLAATVTPGTTWQGKRYRFDSALGHVLDTKLGKSIAVTSTEWLNLLRVIVQDPPPPPVRLGLARHHACRFIPP